MNIQPLFPQPLIISELAREFTDTEMTFVRSLELTANQMNLHSIDKDVLLHTEFSDIKRFIEDQLDIYTKNVLCASNIQLYITQSWINVTEPEKAHHQHIHPNSIVSGVMYFQVADDGNDKIRFYNKNTFYPLTIDPEQYNIYNSTTWSMPVVPKRLFLFPSLTPHDVPKINGTSTRISLSFNTFLKGDVGNADKMYHLKL